MVAGSRSGGATREVRSDQKRSPMMASAMTDVMMMSQIGQPAASMIDSTRGFLPRNAVDFSPPTTIPQGLVRAPHIGHNGVANPLDAIRIESAPGLAFLARILPPDAASSGNPRVGFWEVSGLCVTDVANHPQSLWITLWTAFRLEAQVA